MTEPQIQIIRHLTHAIVIVRGPNDRHQYAMLKPDVTPEHRTVRRMVRRVKKGGKKCETSR